MASGSVSDGPAPRVGAADASFRQQLHDGIAPRWQEGRVKYDVRHFMANFSNMSAAEKSSPLFRTFIGYVSDALFKMLPGEADTVRAHMVMLGMTDERIRRTRRKYWRRRARYSCPAPAVILDGLLDVFEFFNELDDPQRPGHKFYVTDAETIFVKECGYVQRGELSDVPGLNYYFLIRQARTGLRLYRCLRSTSQEEGYHLHLRAAQHPTARGSSGPRFEVARTDLFDFAWNVRAAERANQRPKAGHYHLWLIDALFDICKGIFEGDDAPPALQGFRRLDTTLAPLTWRGINWEGLKELKAQGAQALELSSLRSPADVAKVLEHPLLIVRHDAAGIARETGVLTSEKRLAAFLARLTAQAASRQLLDAHGVEALRHRLRVTDGGLAPSAVARPPLLPVVPEAFTTGPLPLAADAVRSDGAGDVVIEDPPPLRQPLTADKAANLALKRKAQLSAPGARKR